MSCFTCSPRPKGGNLISRCRRDGGVTPSCHHYSDNSKVLGSTEALVQIIRVRRVTTTTTAATTTTIMGVGVSRSPDSSPPWLKGVSSPLPIIILNDHFVEAYP